MSLHLALAAASFAAAVFLVAALSPRLLGAVALVAAGVKLAMALGLLHLAIARLPLGMVLALGVAIPGLVAWIRSQSKGAVTAATAVTLAGSLQVIELLGRRL